MDTFHIPQQKVAKINEPLLVVGLGGTGADALLNVMDKFKKRFVLPKVSGVEQDAPARTAYLSLDTDTNVLNKRVEDTSLNQTEFFDLSLPTMGDLLDPKKSRALLKSYELAWIDQHLQSLNAAFGAGGVRQCGRFMLCKKAEPLVQKLKTLIQNLMAVTAGAADGGSITVVVLAGLAGGTGSGTFLDIAYLVRHVMTAYFVGIKLNLMGFFILPDVNLSHSNFSDAQQQVLKTNGFAALKELDFWMNYDNHKLLYRHKYTENMEVEWTQPYNDVVLLSEKNENGVVIKNAYDVVLDTISETLMHFMASERNAGTDGFTYQSHKVNIQSAMAQLNRSYPANYCYMAIGAASTESQQTSMVLYEAKLAFDSLLKLKDNDSLLESHFPQTFHASVLPPMEDPYQLFDVVYPLPSCFHGEPGYSYAEIRNNCIGDNALHSEPLSAYLKNARINVLPFVKEYTESVWNRFQSKAVEAIHNPKIGPFRFLEYLNDPENGFVSKMEKWKAYWQAEVDTSMTTVASQQSNVIGNLFPAMVNTPWVEKLLTEKKARSYVEASELLYVNARNHVVAEKLLEAFTVLLERARNYAQINLASFNRILESMSKDLTQEISSLQNKTQLSDTQLISFPTLKSYIDDQFNQLKGGLNASTEQVLKQLAAMSFQLQIDSTHRRVSNIEEKQREFSELVEKFIAATFQSINHVTLDGVLDMTMPDSDALQRENYVAQTLLPKLRNSALTMYQTHSAMQNVANSYIGYSYVSVPYDAETMKKGLEKFKASGEPITPKESDITDRLYWLKTYNCLPLCRFAMLADLEKSYENSLQNTQVHGVHLVYNTESEAHRGKVRGTWLTLPSPTPHLLLGEQFSKRQKADQGKLAALMSKAFALNIVTLAQDQSAEGIDVWLKKDAQGHLVEDETFCEQVRAIMKPTNVSDEEKTRSLLALKQGLSVTHVRYDSYVSEFAKTLGLIVEPTSNTATADEEARRNRETVRQYIAGYMLQKRPDLLESVESQLHMFEVLGRELEGLEGKKQAFELMLNYASRLSQLLFLNMVRTGFGCFKMDMPDAPDAVLFSNSQIRPDEQTLPPVLALLNALASGDDRIEPMKRRYLEDQAQKRLARLDQLTEVEQAEFVMRAKSFVEKYASTPERMKYDEALTQEQREKQSRLLQQMLNTAHQFTNQ